MSIPPGGSSREQPNASPAGRSGRRSVRSLREKSEAGSVRLVEATVSDLPDGIPADGLGISRDKALCSDCFETVYGEEPDMSDEDGLSWEPGTCTRCDTSEGKWTARTSRRCRLRMPDSGGTCPTQPSSMRIGMGTLARTGRATSSASRGQVGRCSRLLVLSASCSCSRGVRLKRARRPRGLTRATTDDRAEGRHDLDRSILAAHHGAVLPDVAGRPTDAQLPACASHAPTLRHQLLRPAPLLRHRPTTRPLRNATRRQDDNPFRVVLVAMVAGNHPAEMRATTRAPGPSLARHRSWGQWNKQPMVVRCLVRGRMPACPGSPRSHWSRPIRFGSSTSRSRRCLTWTARGSATCW